MCPFGLDSPVKQKSPTAYAFGEKVERDTELDNYMDAEQAKAYGIIDEVIAPRR